MRNRTDKPISAAVFALLALSFGSEPIHAFDSYGKTVDDFCTRNERVPSQPYIDNCDLCHTSGFGKREPWFSYSKTGQWSEFCPDQATNLPPDGRITSPTGNLTLTVGDTFRFAATGNDPDGDTPLTYQWNFDGGAYNRSGAGPFDVTFANEGIFTVRLTVSDSLGLEDLQPDTLTITVEPPPLICTDDDGDGFNTDGGDCGAIDCDDADASINPNATEDCTDGIDNNCDGKIDMADPLSVGCPGCMDADGDLFSPDGDICGPLDCNDLDPSINPGAAEACGDGIDNDCDFDIDQDDTECDGSDCIGKLVHELDLALRVSLWPNRESWVALQDTIVSDSIYVFIASEPGIVQVRYFLDGDPVQTESMAPWDFAGGSDTLANPLDTRTLLDGQHTILAEIDLDDRPTVTRNANFTVENGPRLTIDIAKAEWDAGEEKLSVEGTWRKAGVQVKVTNADTGVLIGTTYVQGDDDSDDDSSADSSATGIWAWKLELEHPTSVPCRVRVEIQGEFGEADVANAPAGCDGGPENRSPVANDDDVTTDEDQAITVNVLANDTDADNDTLSVANLSQGGKGTAQHDGARITYTPNANASGMDSFTYTVIDGQGGTDSASVTVTIRPVNDAPSAADDSAETAANEPVVIAVLDNDSDVEGEVLTVVSVSTPANGTSSTDGNRVTYVPNQGFDGLDSFSYTASDGHHGTDTAAVTVTVKAASNPGIQGVLGLVTANESWEAVDYDPTFSKPVVIAGPPSFEDADPGVVRLRRVGTTGFELRFQEWDYLADDASSDDSHSDDSHSLESIPYLVLEEGRQVLPDGTGFQVGTFELSGTKKWKTLSFSESFQGTPRLFLTAQTSNGGQAIATRARRLSRSSFQAALFEQESLNDGHLPETVGFVAIYHPDDAGTLGINDQDMPYSLSAVGVNHRWKTVGAFSLKVEEEQSRDDEVRHTSETVNLLILGDRLFAQDVLTRGGDTAALRQR